MFDGILPFNKPAGMSSFDVIRTFKRKTEFRGKIGHGGTLDVFASGVVLLLLGSATRRFDELLTLPKRYRAAARLDYRSTTLDVEGELTALEPGERLTWEQIRAALPPFLGEIEQSVPLYSAAKQNGQPLYKLARKSAKIRPKSKPVRIYDIDLVACKHPLVTFDVSCSSGTYIRQLTWDIFQSVQRESFLFSLIRTQVGEIPLTQCCELAQLDNESWKEFLLAADSTDFFSTQP